MRVTYDNFSGGVNTFIDPQKLPPTHAVDVSNAEIVSGSIASVPAPDGISTPIIPEVKYNPTGNRSLAKFGEAYYWSDNDTGELSSSLGYIGVRPPESSPGVIKQWPGVTTESTARFDGTYKYAAIFNTFDGFSSAPSASLEMDNFWTNVETTTISTTASPTNAPRFSATKLWHVVHPLPHYSMITAVVSSHDVTSTDQRSYRYAAGSVVEYGGRAYKTYVDYESVPSDPARIFKKNLRGWTTPAEPLLPPGTPYQWPVSPWVDITGVLNHVRGADIIEIEVPASSETSVVSVTILRTVKNGSTFYPLVTLPNGTGSYMDMTEDTNLVLQVPPVLTNHTPPVDENPPFSGGKFLTALHEVFYLAVGDRLYLSEQSNPHAWDPLKFMVFEDEITALVPTQASVIVFTKNRRYFITGSTFADLQKVQLPTLQGCPNWRTATTVGNHIVWQSNDGVAIFGKQPEIEGDQVQLLTADKYTFDKIANFAVSANEVYYMFFDDHVVAIDFKHGATITKRNINGLSASVYDQNDDRLYFLTSLGRWEEDGTGDDATWSYTTPRLEPAPDKNEGTRLPKKLRRLWVDADNDVDMTVFVDGEERWSKVLKKRARRDLSTYFKAGLIGQDVQFRFSSKGTMRSFTVDFRLAKGA